MTRCTRASAENARSQARVARPPMLCATMTGGRPVACVTRRTASSTVGVRIDGTEHRLQVHRHVGHVRAQRSSGIQGQPQPTVVQESHVPAPRHAGRWGHRAASRARWCCETAGANQTPPRPARLATAARNTRCASVARARISLADGCISTKAGPGPAPGAKTPIPAQARSSPWGSAQAHQAARG